MTIIDFVEWCNKANVYSAAMNSCKEAFLKILKEM